MAIFEITGNALTPVEPTSFEDQGVSERGDIQRLLRERIDCLEAGLIVLAEEFSGWQDSSRRIDLLCLDRDANLVVVELKRSGDGGHMELQAIRYAAMISAMTFDQAVAAFARYRRLEQDVAAAELLSFLEWSDVEEERFGRETRILLAAADFSKELTTSVMWLREHGMDVRCIRLKPYRMEDGRLLMDIQPLIPLPEAAAFQTQLGAKRLAERKENVERHDLRYRFWEQLLTRAREQTSLHAGRSPTRGTWISGSIGRTGYSLDYGVTQQENKVYLWIADDKPAFEKLHAQRAEIEAQFGDSLIWRNGEGQKGCSIAFLQEGGYRSPVESWPAIQDRMIDAMIRLDKAIRSKVVSLR